MKSMTGFGVSQITFQERRYFLEIRTVNHRFCELNLRFPPKYSALENEIADLAKKSFARGRIDILLREKGEQDENKLVIDDEKLKYYLKQIKSLSQKLKLKEEISLIDLIKLPHVISLREEEISLKSLGLQLKQLFQKAALEVSRMREKEGKAIKLDFLAKLKIITRNLNQIETIIPSLVTQYQQRMKERIEKIMGSDLNDHAKLVQEVAFWVDRCDVSEEIQRLKTHIDHFKQVLEEKETVGRKLEFILQEIHRELNTLGSKSQSTAIMALVVQAKHELEKMREMVQNVE